jgi:Fe-S-cluster containining protein
MNTVSGGTRDKKGTGCERCGKCCLADVAAYIDEEDLLRWKNEGRTDILGLVARAGGVWAGDRLISSAGGRILGCIFFIRDGAHGSCSIYETRPRVCRNYVPGSSELCPQWSN